MIKVVRVRRANTVSIQACFGIITHIDHAFMRQATKNMQMHVKAKSNIQSQSVCFVYTLHSSVPQPSPTSPGPNPPSFLLNKQNPIPK